MVSGVIKSMEAALDYLGMGSLEGKRVAIQGAGLVGTLKQLYLFSFPHIKKILHKHLNTDRP